MKCVQIRSFFWSVFSPNEGRYGPEKTPYLDTFYAVAVVILSYLRHLSNKFSEKGTFSNFGEKTSKMPGLESNQRY